MRARGIGGGALTGSRSRVATALVLAVLAAALPAAGDDLGDDASFAIDPRLEELLRRAGAATGPVPVPLWRYRDGELQSRLEDLVGRLGLRGASARGELALALVDLLDLDRPRVAAVNGDRMMYAASLPKIAVLLAAFEKIARGELALDADLRGHLEHMIRDSSNASATHVMHVVGKRFIAEVLLSPRYRFYDPARGGGLWVGKDYARAGLWMRDPLHRLSHGATALQVARFYTMLARDELVSPRYSRMMKQILGRTSIEHKFVRGLRAVRPRAAIYRKSGSWRGWHSDSALVEHEDGRYVAVALSSNPAGRRWLPQLIVGMDAIIADFERVRRLPAVALPAPGPLRRATR